MIWLNGLLFLVSLLAVFKAPAKPLWFLAIGVTEWGHLLAILSLILAFGSWRLTRRWTYINSLALTTAVLYLTPLLRAEFVAQALPSQLAAVFGNIAPRDESQAVARPQPLRLFDLFRGVHSPPIKLTTLVYATVEGKPLSLDLYQPARSEIFQPVVLVIHGGSWQSGRRGELPDLNRYLAARGYVVASIDYRLAPQATFPNQREDVFAAISYLKKHALEIGLDPGRLVLLGRSAGGQIALSAAYSQKDPSIRGVIAFYTPSDLVWGYANPSPRLIMNSCKVIENYLGGPPAQVPAAYPAASPVQFVNKTTPPTLMIHGERDELVSPLHDERLARQLTEFKRPFLYLRLPWATHGCDANFSGPSGQISTYAVERFLAAVMPAAPKEMIAMRAVSDVVGRVSERFRRGV